MADCGYAAFLLLTGPPAHVPAFVAFACVVIGNAAVVFAGWRADAGLLVPARAGRSGGRKGGSHGRSLAGDAGDRTLRSRPVPEDVLGFLGVIRIAVVFPIAPKSCREPNAPR